MTDFGGSDELREHGADWSDWGEDHPEEGPSCRCGYNGSPEECVASRDELRDELRAAFVAQHPDPDVYWDDDMFKAICTICGSTDVWNEDDDDRAYSENPESRQELGYKYSLARHVQDSHAGTPLPSEVAGERFDRWLAAHDSVVAAKALEGWRPPVEIYDEGEPLTLSQDEFFAPWNEETFRKIADRVSQYENDLELDQDWNTADSVMLAFALALREGFARAAVLRVQGETK